MSIFLALDSLATPLVGAPLAWKQSLSGPQFGTLVGKLLFKVFVFTLLLCGYIWAANTWAPNISSLLVPVLPLIVLVGVPLLYAYIKLTVLRLHGLNLSGLWLLLLFPLTEVLRMVVGALMDKAVHSPQIIILLSIYSLQRSFKFLMLLLMALPSPKKVRFAPATVPANTQYFYIAYFLIVLSLLGVFNAGPLQYGININVSYAQLQ